MSIQRLSSGTSCNKFNEKHCQCCYQKHSTCHFASLREIANFHGARSENFNFPLLCFFIVVHPDKLNSFADNYFTALICTNGWARTNSFFISFSRSVFPGDGPQYHRPAWRSRVPGLQGGRRGQSGCSLGLFGVWTIFALLCLCTTTLFFYFYLGMNSSVKCFSFLFHIAK